jgi:glucokinase
MHSLNHDDIFLVGDVGGTNTTLALVGRDKMKFTILASRRFSTKEEQSLIRPIEVFLSELSQKWGKLDLHSCCVSAAGPVREGFVQLTNASWSIDASQISAKFGFPTIIINDFTAISYAVVLLNHKDSSQITMMPHLGAVTEEPSSGVALVVGAGTGLGVGYVEKLKDGGYKAFPSEGGHSDLPCHDNMSRAFHKWLQNLYGTPPGIELAVSGQGIANIFSFLCSGSFRDGCLRGDFSDSLTAFDPVPTSLAMSILSLPETERPPLIASNKELDPLCGLAMNLFVEIYARKVSSLSALFLPKGGIYLAGGISTKNEAFLLEGNRFMRPFEQNYAPHIREFLSTVPVMIVRDYAISLIGAANAAYQLTR